MSDTGFYIVDMPIGGENMESYSHWTIDELATKLQNNRVLITQLQDENIKIVEVLEGRWKQVKEVMYND